MKKPEIDRKFGRMLLIREIVDFSSEEGFIDMPVKYCPSVMHMRLGFAVAACLEPEILLVDESLAWSGLRMLTVEDAVFQRCGILKLGQSGSKPL